MLLKIDINVDKKVFYVSGEIESILRNKRLLTSLKRLSYGYEKEKINIPYIIENQVKCLQELESVLKKFNYKVTFSDKISVELGSYKRETEEFDKFSEKARIIRNNEFNENPELYQLFSEFHNVLERDLVRPLYPLQELSAFHMAFAKNSCNFAVPGAGKTSIVYGAYAYLKSLPEDHSDRVNNLLVIGPLSSFAPWENEYKECFGKNITSFRMSGDSEITKKQKEQHLYSPTPSELTLIFHGGVERFQKDILNFLRRNKTMVVVDEAHRIKNPEGVWGKSVTEISKEAIARVILTGTPVPNGYQDIYNLFKFIYPFKFKEILKVHYHNLEDMTANCQPEAMKVQELKEKISPYFIRIKKSDLGLPEIEENIIPVSMNTFQREIYDFIESSYIEDFKVDKSATVKDILNKAKLIRLRQASTNPALLSKTLKDSLSNNEWEYDPNSQFTTDSDVIINDSEFFKKIVDYPNFETPNKFILIKKLLEQDIIISNNKVIIWTIFIQNAKDLEKFLKNYNINSKLLIGEIPQETREKTINMFNNPANLDFQVVIANPFSVAESISLHKGCHNAIYMERDYNCSNFLQSKDRIHRVGLDENQITRYFYFISTNSIDEVINQRLEIKIKRMEEIIDDEIPLLSRIDDLDETDIIQELISNYDKRT